MPWAGGIFTRTNGTYSGAAVWQSDAAAAIKIRADRHDTHDQDLAQGINNTLTKDGQNSPNQNINWGGFKITSLGAGAATTDAATFGQTITGAAWNGNTLSLTRVTGGNVTVGISSFSVTPSVFVGTVGTQQGMMLFGWNNGIQRWAPVMEATAALALYSYDAAGGTPTPRFSIQNGTGDGLFGGSLTVAGGVLEAKRPGGLTSSITAYDGNGSLGVVMSQGFNTNTDLIGYVFNRANADLNIGTNNTARMCITAAGRIQLGIGSFGITSVTVSASAPGALADGAIWFQY